MSFVAISKVKYPVSAEQQLQQLGLDMLPIARRQAGFIAVGFYQATESNETMMYWEWESQADHQACMASEAWLALMEQSNALFELDGVEFSVETYRRLG